MHIKKFFEATQDPHLEEVENIFLDFIDANKCKIDHSPRSLIFKVEVRTNYNTRIENDAQFAEMQKFLSDLKVCMKRSEYMGYQFYVTELGIGKANIQLAKKTEEHQQINRLLFGDPPIMTVDKLERRSRIGDVEEIIINLIGLPTRYVFVVYDRPNKGDSSLVIWILGDVTDDQKLLSLLEKMNVRYTLEFQEATVYATGTYSPGGPGTTELLIPLNQKINGIS